MKTWVGVPLVRMRNPSSAHHSLPPALRNLPHHFRTLSVTSEDNSMFSALASSLRRYLHKRRISSSLGGIGSPFLRTSPLNQSSSTGNVNARCNAIDEVLEYGLACSRRVRMDGDSAGSVELVKLLDKLYDRMRLERD